jgi:hypothetical protein
MSAIWDATIYDSSRVLDSSLVFGDSPLFFSGTSDILVGTQFYPTHIYAIYDPQNTG